MNGQADIALLGALLADDARASMVLTLLGGDAIPAGELARRAGVSPSGASAHLKRLREGGLVTQESVGRHRYFRLASPELAEALESLARVAPVRPASSFRESESTRALKHARTCYDHLAGELGVAVADALVDRGVLTRTDEAFAVTDAGTTWLASLGIDVEEVAASRRSFARACLDWSEQRPHLAGSLGAAVADAFFARKWIRRLPGGRAVAVTPDGRAWLARELGLSA
ncbi:MAG TPA: helix-turn-helix domain-containing protein [Gaiellaceae bacterium]